VGFDGTNWVILWSDERMGPSLIYGARMTPSGALLDPRGFAVTTGPRDGLAPCVGSTAVGHMLIAYSSSMPCAYYDHHHIWGNLWTPLSTEAGLQLLLAPNPFRMAVQISFKLPGYASVRLAVYDAAGRLVKTIAHGDQYPGWHHETWDGRDHSGKSLPSGIYFARIQCEYGRASKKCVLVR